MMVHHKNLYLTTMSNVLSFISVCWYSSSVFAHISWIKKEGKTSNMNKCPNIVRCGGRSKLISRGTSGVHLSNSRGCSSEFIRNLEMSHFFTSQNILLFNYYFVVYSSLIIVFNCCLQHLIHGLFSTLRVLLKKN